MFPVYHYGDGGAASGGGCAYRFAWQVADYPLLPATLTAFRFCLATYNA